MHVDTQINDQFNVDEDTFNNIIYEPQEEYFIDTNKDNKIDLNLDNNLKVSNISC